MAERIYWSRTPKATTFHPNVTYLNPNTRKNYREACDSRSCELTLACFHLDGQERTFSGAMRHWLALSDIYTFPHVTLFDSGEHLVQLLRTTDLEAISAKMRKSNRRMLRRLRDTWRRLFLRMFQGQAPGG